MEILPKTIHRINGKHYLFKGEEVIWGSNRINCKHNRNKNICKDCGGKGICKHNKIKYECKDCDGISICEHNIKRSKCKDCGGGSICKHNKRKNICKDCGGKSICIHNRQINTCKDCGGKSICEHFRLKYTCKDCGGKGICEHDREKSKCKDCKGGNVCQHNRIRSRCKDCYGGSICKHTKHKDTCNICSPNQYLSGLLRRRVYDSLKNYENRNKKHTFEYVGCNLQELREHLEKQFTIGMSWENQGQWHIDHIRPCASFDLSKEEERHKCFHYKNLQPLWASDNLSKGSKYCQEITNK
jgi:hypothetical protein